MKKHRNDPMARRAGFPKCFSLLILAGLTGCATPSIYHWGKFEDGLHQRYVDENHAEADTYLIETIRASEQQNLRVPPGAYADYGFLLFKRGDRDGAIAFFEKEKQFFPESSAFMTKLIERIRQKEKEAGATQDSPAQASASMGAMGAEP